MNVLAIGAHPDDIELGCAGTLLAHRVRGEQIAMLVLTRGERGPRGARSRIDEQESAALTLGARLYWGDYEDGEIDSGRSAVTLVERVIADCGADTVYVHVPRDSHQDHRAAAVATMAAARRTSRVLLYESPTSLAFSPTLFVDVARHLAGKLTALRAHASQIITNGLVDLEAVEAQARYRGFQARMRHAEAFESARMTWDLSVPDTLDDEFQLAEAAFSPSVLNRTTASLQPEEHGIILTEPTRKASHAAQ